MRKNKIYWLNTFLIFQLFCMTATAGIVPVTWTWRLQTGVTTTVKDTVVTEVLPYKTGSFKDVNVEDIVTVGIDPNYTGYLGKDSINYQVTLKIDGYNASNSLISTTNQTLTVIYNPFSKTFYKDQATYTFDKAYKTRVQFMGIVTNGSSSTSLPNWLYIDNTINVERYYAFSSYITSNFTFNTPTLINTDCDAGNIYDEIELSWNYGFGSGSGTVHPETYDLEWTFVNDYDTVVGLYKDSTKIAYDFSQNSTRINTINNSYRISLIYEHGFLVYRLRGVGNDTSNINNILPGAWNTATTGTVSSVSHYRIIQPHQTDSMNWQYNASFAEEGKKKEVVAYYDGSLRNRQSVTKMNSDKNTLVGETIYDYQGRPAINVLPVPVDSPLCSGSEAAIKFYPNFNKDDSTYAYSRNDFDVDSAGSSCTSSIAPMGTNSGASHYYSPANPNKREQQAFVPDAKKYPFTQVEYTPDNTGRIRRQGGVGINHQFNSGHETKYFYGQPSQLELDRMFGSEVGDALHYKKNLVVDANGQSSIAYINMEGRTIATSLAGDSIPYVNDIPSNKRSALKTLTYDLFNKNALGHSKIDTVNISGNSIEFNSQLLVAYASTQNFSYSLSIDTMKDPCLNSGICFNCIYDLEMHVYNDCGVDLLEQYFGDTLKTTIGHFTKDSDSNLVFNINCDSSLYRKTYPFSILMQPGNYTVSKVLTVNQQALNYYIAQYEDSVNNNCYRTLNNFVDSALSKVDTSSCHVTCASCVAALGDRDAFVAAGKGTYMDYDGLVDACNEPCQSKSNCYISYLQMVADMAPSGQYGQYLDNTGSIKPHAILLSVYNDSTNNSLPKNFGTDTANWHHPSIILNNIVYPNYTDENGHISTINIVKDTVGYTPQVIDTTKVKYNSSTNTYYTQPENLKNFKDLLYYWDANWAKSLVIYHPEYCYYVNCLSFSNTYGGTYSSDAFDALLQNTNTFAGAVSTKFIKYNYHNFSFKNRLYDFSQVSDSLPYDPFLLHGGSFGNTLKYDITHYHTLNSGYLASMTEVAAYSVRCGNLYGNTTNTGCINFGDSAVVDSIRNNEWQAFLGFYISEKEGLQHQYLDSIVKGSGCPAYNSCMGDSSSTYNGSLALGSTEYGDIHQPCGATTYHLYVDKIKRFSSSSSELPSDYSSVSYQYFLQTGQCPIAVDLQGLLNQIIAYGKLKSASSVALQNYTAFTPDLYKTLGGGSPYKKYYWNSSTTGGIINSVFKDSASNTKCTLTFNLDSAGISSLTHYKIIGVSGLSDTTYSSYSNAFRIYFTMLDTTDTTIIYKRALGYSSCFNLVDCKFQETCVPNDFASDLQKLMSALATNNKLYSSNVSLDAGYASYVTIPIKNQLGASTSNKLIWTFTDSTHYQLYDSLTPSVKLLVNLLGKPQTTTGFKYNFMKSFTGINSDYYNLFTIIPLNNTNGVFGTTQHFMTGEAFKQVVVSGDTTNSPISMGSCGYPTSFSCKGNEYRLQNDLQVLLHDVLIGMPSGHNVDLTKDINYTYLLSNAFPTGLSATSSTLHTNTPAPGLNPHYKTQLLFTVKSNIDSCYFSLNADTINHHSFDSIIDFSSLKSYGPPDSYGDYHAFYGIAKYSVGAGTPSTDTIFGQSCLPIKICCACATSDTISFNDGGGANGAGSGNYNPLDTCHSLYHNYVLTIDSFCSTPYAVRHNSCRPRTEDEAPGPFWQRFTYDDVLLGHYCGCLNAYNEYLSHYMHNPDSLLGPPVPISSFTNCPNNNTNTYPNQCSTVYSLDTGIIGKYNIYVTTYSISLPQISNTQYTSASFGTNGFCYCAQPYVAFIKSIIDGATLPATVDTNMLDIAKYCQNKYLPPCKPYVQPDTANSGFPTSGFSVTPKPDSSCGQYAMSVAIQNATNQYNQYKNNITTSISGKYLKHCLGAFESFTQKYLDKEYHYTLYYYDQAGNLIRTIPPEGVHLVGDTVSPTAPITTYNTAEDSICRDRTYNQHTFLTGHTMPTTYVYNSLNQLVKQGLPDHDPMEIWEYALPIGIDTKLKVTGVQFVDENTGYLTGYTTLSDTIKPGIIKRGYIYQTVDGGKSWVPMQDVVASYLNKIQMITSYSGYAVGNQGILLKTIDGGQTWDVVPTYNKYTNVWTAVPDWKDLYFKDTTKGVIVGSGGKSLLIDFTQSNRAKYIKPVSLNTGHTDNLTGVTYDGSFVYASAVSTDGTYGLIYKSNLNPFSTDSLKWDSVPTFKGDQLLAVQFLADSTKGFMGGAKGALLKTKNRGVTWTTISSDLTGDIRNLFFRNDSVGIALVDSAASHLQLYKTSNGGVNWTLVGSKGKYYKDMAFYKYANSATSDKAYVVGANGSINRLIANTIGTYGHTPYFGISPLNSPNVHKTFTSVTATNYTVSGVQKSKVVIGTSDGMMYYSFNNADSTYIKWDSLPLSSSSVAINKIALSFISNQYFIAAIGSDNNLYGAKITSTTTNTNVVSGSFTGITINAGKTLSYTYNNTKNKISLLGFTGTSITQTTLGVSPPGIINVNSIACSGNLDLFMVGDSGGVYKDTSIINSSRGWATTRIVPSPLYDIQTDNGTAKAIYAVGKGGTVLMKQPTLSTWKKLKIARSNNFNAIKFYKNTNAVIAADSGKLYTMVIDTTTSAYALTGIHNVTPYQTQKFNDVSINFPNKEAVAVGNSGTVLYIHDVTTDTFAKKMNIGVVTNDLQGVQTFTSSATAFVGANNSIYKTKYSYSSSILTTTYIQRLGSIYPQTINKAHFADDNNGYLVGDNSFIRHTNDGNTWQIVPPNVNRSSPDTLNNVLTYQDNQAVIIGQRGYMASINNVGTPATISTSGLSGSPNLNDIALCPNTPGLAYVVGNTKTAFKLSIPAFGITTFSIPSISFSSTYNLKALHIFLDNSFITVGTKGTIAFYNNGSNTWYEQDPPLTPSTYSFNDVLFTDDQNGYVVGDKGVVLRWSTLQNIQKLNTSLVYPSTNFKSKVVKTIAYGVPDSTKINITAVGFPTRYEGFLGGLYPDSITNADYTRLLHDELENFSTFFCYDRLGRMVVSQNTKQYQSNPKTYSYSLYDALGRITEVGQKTENDTGLTFNKIFYTQGVSSQTNIGSGFNTNQVDYNTFTNWVLTPSVAGLRTNVTHTFYDTTAIIGIPLTQQNLRKRVSSVTIEKLNDNNPLTYDHATHYTYDIHGNVNTMLQDNPSLVVVNSQYKRIDYDYDLISGKVNYVYYQKDSIDQFSHKYEYDPDNRIIDVSTSHDGVVWDKDAKYLYYAHGPLARVELGNNQTQGIDYYYTLQGWIKGVNSNVLKPGNDGGKDGLAGSVNSNFARDAYGYTLGYFSGDYSPIDTTKWNPVSNRFEANTASSSLLAARQNLFNGNIGHMATTIIKPDTNYAAQTILPQGAAYKYDQLNRLVEMKAFTNISSNAWGTTTYNGSYNNRFSYDENGNILSQVRKNQSGVTFDSLIYRYNIQSGKKLQNRLYSVHDTISASVMSDDIDNEVVFYSSPGSINTANNYQYDQIGNLVKDSAQGISKIVWNVYNKIDSIIYHPSFYRLVGGVKQYPPDLAFNYDAAGNRISKTSMLKDSTKVLPAVEWTTYYYQRDAQGNVLSVYKKYETPEPGHCGYPGCYSLAYDQIEKHVYGSSRIGMDVKTTHLLGVAIDTVNLFHNLGDKHYEMSNHLGNVLTTISDNKLPVDTNHDGTIDRYVAKILSSTDYAAFGAPMDGRTFNSGAYREGFNGKEKDDETFGGGNEYDYGARMFDSRLGRFMSVDPLSDKYPYYSTYQFAGNRPIGAIDVDGLEPADIAKGTKNLIIVVQGYGTEPKNGATQVDNAVKVNESNGRDKGLGAINAAYFGKASQVVTFASSPSENTESDILNSVKSFKKDNPTGKVVLVGHSLGAYNIENVVNSDQSVQYDLVVTIDPSGASLFNGASMGSQKLSSNVKNAINYKNPVRNGTAGGTVTFDEKTNGANIDVQGTGHTNIDNTIAPHVMGDILRVINGLDPVKKAKERDPSKVKPVPNDSKNGGGSSD